MAVARSSSRGVAIRYVLPVLQISATMRDVDTVAATSMQHPLHNAAAASLHLRAQANAAAV